MDCSRVVNSPNVQITNKMHLNKLLNAEGPIRWKPLFLEENLHEMDLEVVPEGELSLLNFADKLIKCYNAYEKKNLEKALEIIGSGEASFEKLQRTTFVSDIKDALLHIIHSTKSILYMNENNEEQCLKILDGMKDFNKLNEINKAAVYAIRSLCLALYSYDGTRTAADSINMALSKDPNCPWWLFLKGFYLRKLRKLQNPNDTPSLEEREIFEKINNQMNEPLFMVHLADAYRETAVSSDKRKKIFWFMSEDSGKIDLKNEINNMWRKSKQYYEKSFELRPQCPLIAFRCAYGLLKLPQAYQNVKLAKDILIKMLPKHKNSGFGNLVNGFYHETFSKNANTAKQYLDTAVQLHVFSANMNIIKLKHAGKENNFSALEHLEAMLENFKESPKQALILSQIISYFIFVKLDLALACDYLIQYFKKKRVGNCLEKHNSCFIRTPEPISLIDVVTDEVKYAMGDKTMSPELRDKLTKFIHLMQFAGIIVLKGKAQNLRKQILEGKIVNTFSGFSTQPNTHNWQDNILRYQPGYHTQFSENRNFNAGPRQRQPFQQQLWLGRGRGGNFSCYESQRNEHGGFVGKMEYFNRTRSPTMKKEIRSKSEFDTLGSPSLEYRCKARNKEDVLSRRSAHDEYREHGDRRRRHRHSSRDKYHHRKTRLPSWCSSDSEYERNRRKKKSRRKRSSSESESSSSKYSSEQSSSQAHKRRHESSYRRENRRSLSKVRRHRRRLSIVRRHRRSASRERRLLETPSYGKKERSNPRREYSPSASHYTSTSSESFERVMKGSHKSGARDVKALSQKFQAIQMGESKRYSKNNREEGREKTWKNSKNKLYNSEREKERRSDKKQRENRKQEAVGSKGKVKRGNKKIGVEKSYSKSENDSDSVEEK